MPTPDQAEALTNLSAFALFVFLTGFIATALFRRWLVFGFFYDQERASRLTAETQAERNATALEESNRSMAAQTAVIAEQAREMAGVRREMRALRDEILRNAGRADHA